MQVAWTGCRRQVGEGGPLQAHFYGAVTTLLFTAASIMLACCDNVGMLCRVADGVMEEQPVDKPRGRRRWGTLLLLFST